MNGVYEQLVYELGSRDHRGVVALDCDPQVARFALPEGTTVALLRHDAGDPTTLEAGVARVLAAHPRGRVQLVATGGGPEALDLLERAGGERRLGRRIERMAVDDRGELRLGPGADPDRDLQAALDEARRHPGRLRIDEQAFATWMADRAEAARAVSERAEAHDADRLARKPWATVALAVTAGVLFVLELLWGGYGNTTTLVRMGALASETAQATEPWRPLASSFLSAGPLQLVASLAALVVLGSTLERLLGPWRLLAVWTASVAVGSLAALAMTKGVVVGAGAGTWGLMGALALLAVRADAALPPAPIRLHLAIGAGLNLALAFLPGASWPALVAGGLAGALPTLFGLSSLGILRAERAVTATRRDPMATPVAAAGVLSALLLAGSLTAALVQGQPWLSGADGPWTTHELGVPGATIDLPASMGEPREAPVDAQTRDLEFGDPLTGSWSARVHVARFVPKALTSLRLFREYRTHKKSLEELPADHTRVGDPTEAEQKELFTLDDELVRGDGTRVWRHLRVVPTGAFYVTLETTDPSAEPIHERVLAGLKTGYEPQDEEPVPESE